jgi:acyl carrier protein
MAGALPEFMVPQHYVRLEKMPLSQNGKLDRKVLPGPSIISKEDFIAPGNRVEEELVKIWSEVLAIDRNDISVNQSFFHMGGNSIKIIQLNMLVNETFGQNLSIPDMFRYTTIISIAEFIKGKKGVDGYKTKVSSELAGMQNVIDAFNEL